MLRQHARKACGTMPWQSGDDGCANGGAGACHKERLGVLLRLLPHHLRHLRDALVLQPPHTHKPCEPDRQWPERPWSAPSSGWRSVWRGRADLGRVRVLRSGVGGVQKQDVNRLALELGVLRHAVVPTHVPRVQNHLPCQPALSAHGVATSKHPISARQHSSQPALSAYDLTARPAAEWAVGRLTCRLPPASGRRRNRNMQAPGQ